MRTRLDSKTARMLNRIFMLLLGLVLSPGYALQASSGDRLDLNGAWSMQSSVLATGGGAALSKPGAAIREWHTADVPTTVLQALIKAGVYPDVRVGLNAYRIPDSSDEFNARHDLARFSHLPDHRNPWRDPWWFRREFGLPTLLRDRRVWLHFDAINYRAEVWLNGVRIADTNTMAGMFQRFQFDITDAARAGANVLAVMICPVDHPGVPEKQVEPLGRDRGYQSDLMRDVTMVTSIGYDCMMTVPDRNMGLWQNVWIDWSGPVDIRHPFVITRLPLPATNSAALEISAELVNTSSAAIRGVWRGEVSGTDVRFEQPVELAAGEMKLVKIDPSPVLENPRLWWPVNYGEQPLYELALSFEVDGAISKTATVSFGVREVGYEMHEVNGWHGRRLLINGQKIFCRGGYIQPELLLGWDARRMEDEVRYYAKANLNLIYFEDIPNPPEPFLELCDRYGLLFGNVFYSCFWLRPGSEYPADPALLERCTIDLVKRYRNHPSLILYMAMNEEDTKEDVYEMWRRHILALDGTRWFIPSAYFPSDRRNVSEWFKKDLPAGMTDKGASYSWAEPAQYFRWVREARNWMFMMEGGAASVPPMSSLSRFLPQVTDPTPAKRGPLYPLDAAWAHHGANQYYKDFDAALRRLHGEPVSVADYVWKAHLVAADQHRSMFEAVNHRMWDITSGVTQWKINACEPSIQWQTFDWYLKPMVSWYYLKKATEPLHVQLNLPDNTVSVINCQLTAVPNLKVFAQVFDLSAKLLWEKNVILSVRANAYQEAFTVPEPLNATPVYFVKLGLADRIGMISENFYWLAAKDSADLKALASLPPVKLKVGHRVETKGNETIVRVTVRNPGDHVAFFIQLALTRSQGGEEILPVLWGDNYFSLLPGETREVEARLANDVLRGATPVLEVGGWNVEGDVTCAALHVASKEIKCGVPVTLTAEIGRTFLDGSRVPVRVDGRITHNPWAWARGAKPQLLTVPMQFDQPGPHTVEVGGRTLQLTVSP